MNPSEPRDNETTPLPERHWIRKKTRENVNQRVFTKQTGLDCGCGRTCLPGEKQRGVPCTGDDSSRPLLSRQLTVYFRDHKSSTLFSYSVCLPLSSGQFVGRGKHLCINTSRLDDDLGLVIAAVVAAKWMNQLVQSLREIMIYHHRLPRLIRD